MMMMMRIRHNAEHMMPIPPSIRSTLDFPDAQSFDSNKNIAFDYKCIVQIIHSFTFVICHRIDKWLINGNQLQTDQLDNHGRSVTHVLNMIIIWRLFHHIDYKFRKNRLDPFIREWYFSFNFTNQQEWMTESCELVGNSRFGLTPIIVHSTQSNWKGEKYKNEINNQQFKENNKQANKQTKVWSRKRMNGMGNISFNLRRKFILQNCVLIAMDISSYPGLSSSEQWLFMRMWVLSE